MPVYKDKFLKCVLGCFFFTWTEKTSLDMRMGRRVNQEHVLSLDVCGGYNLYITLQLPARGGPPMAAIPAKKAANPK